MRLPAIILLSLLMAGSAIAADSDYVAQQARRWDFTARWAAAGGFAAATADAVRYGRVSAVGGHVRITVPFGALLLPLSQALGGMAAFQVASAFAPRVTADPSDAERQAWKDVVSAKRENDWWWLFGSAGAGALAGIAVERVRRDDAGWMIAGVAAGTLFWQIRSAWIGILPPANR